MAVWKYPDPRCTGCDVLAADMKSLDYFWPEDQLELLELEEQQIRQERVDYVRAEDGTYNRENGHFLCDKCYLRAGMPLGVAP